MASYERNFLTQDCGVAATFVRPWRSNARDPNPEEVNIEYVGDLEKIVELDYRRTCVVVFVCRWVKSNYRRANETIIRDKWGFTLANFQSFERFGKESFVFLKHCEQVFWSNVPELPGWRVVLQPKIRGRRVDNFSSECETSLLFAKGGDSDYEGLHPPQILSEDVWSRPATGREVR